MRGAGQEREKTIKIEREKTIKIEVNRTGEISLLGGCKSVWIQCKLKKL
jgi:hypothetical protein